MTTTNTPTSGAADLPEALRANVDAIMEQAQVFASAWSLVGGRFDNGDGLEDAEAMRSELRDIVVAALAAGQAVAPAQPEGNTGHAEADRLIGRLMSSDPDFEDCRLAAELIQREIKGPDGYNTWREAAIAERQRRVTAATASQAAQQPAQSSAAADTVPLDAAMRAIHQAIDLIGEPDTERLRTVRRVLRGAVVVAEDCKAPQADSQPAPQGETNVQLDTDSNAPAPGQQRNMAGTVALGQPVGNGSDQVAGDPSAQEGKLLTVAERNIRSFLRSATFKSESDREAALNCVDVLYAAARAPADSVLEDAARLDWLDQQCECYGFQHIHEGNRWAINGPYANVRQAIDYERAARKQGGAT